MSCTLCVGRFGARTAECFRLPPKPANIVYDCRRKYRKGRSEYITFYLTEIIIPRVIWLFAPAQWTHFYSVQHWPKGFQTRAKQIPNTGLTDSIHPSHNYASLNEWLRVALHNTFWILTRVVYSAVQRCSYKYACHVKLLPSQAAVSWLR